MARKKKFSMPTAFSIILVLLIGLGLLTHILPEAKFIDKFEHGKVVCNDAYNSNVECRVIDDGSIVCKENTEDDVVGTETDKGVVLCSDINNTENVCIEDEDGVVTCSGDLGEAENTPIKDIVSKDVEHSAENLVNGSGVEAASLSAILMSPILGFENAIDVAIFIMILGGLLAIVNKTGALETGIKVLVKKLKGRELLLIPILMFIFSIGGTTYGMLEETVGFYILLAATMMAAGMDPIVGAATVLLGAGSGVLGSSINPFATGAAISALTDAGVQVNNGMIILIAVALWITTYAISVGFVLSYARKVKADKGSTILSLREQKAADKKFGNFANNEDDVNLSGNQKVTLILFAFTFLIMIIGFIPWEEFVSGKVFDVIVKYTSFLTGSGLGQWWFYEAALWFLIMAIVIGIVNKMGEKTLVDTFIDGADDMIGVVLIIGLARGVSVLMGATYLDNYIIYNASSLLKNLPELLFIPLNYILHIFLSILVPSSSGLASLSTPIIGPLANSLSFNNEVTVMTMVAANGLVNLITPTCGAFMGGLALAKIDYPTWFKWAFKVIATILLVNILILMTFSLIL